MLLSYSCPCIQGCCEELKDEQSLCHSDTSLMGDEKRYINVESSAQPLCPDAILYLAWSWFSRTSL